MRSFLWLSAAIIILMNACTEPISFDEKGVDFLVVSGFISNAEKVHQVRLSRASDYSGDFVVGVTDAELYISDDQGNQTPLQHSEFGYYRTPPDFAGVEGGVYTLFITTAEGHEYVSDPQKLYSKGSLDSVYYEISERERLSEGNGVVSIKGIEYFIDYTLPSEGNTYLMWRWEATYKIRTPFLDGDSDSLGIPNYCYVNEASTDFVKVLNSADLVSREIVKDHFSFVFPGYKYWETYSINVKQYTIGEEVYNFFYDIQKQQENTGSIFDPTPSRINGNIRSLTNPDEVVLGYFGAFGVEEKRIFVQGRDIPKLPEEANAADSALYGGCGGERNSQYCFDCRKFPSGYEEQPEFWE